MKVSDFYKNEYVDQASYTTLRKIGSCIDGQRNTSRKIIHSIIMKSIKDDIKVAQLNSKVAEFTEYLHGDMSGVIVTLAQDYAGTNNVPLLTREGNFGTRFSNEASAPRYIYTYGSPDLFNLFSKDDYPNLTKQYFEGTEIEPVVFVPNLPVLLINGSSGIGSNMASGFSQLILPRNPEKLKSYIVDKLNGELKPKKSNSLEPYFKGFNGDIVQGAEPHKWEIRGKIKRLSSIKIEINELPIGYSLKKYLDILDELEDNKIIKSYKDKSQNDKFLFEVTMSSSDLSKFSDEQLLTKLKLVNKISELYSTIDENNRVKVFNNVKEILDYYIDFKLKYVGKRKEYKISKFDEEIRFDFSKYLFIKAIVDGELTINKRKKSVIEKDLDKFENILRRDDSYDYLLNMNIMSLTEERMKKLQEDIKEKKLKLDELKKTSIEAIWLADLSSF